MLKFGVIRGHRHGDTFVQTVYRYGASSAFPNLTFSTANYWVDVLFQLGPAPISHLCIILYVYICPELYCAGGGTQQFTATGTYSNRKHSKTITSQVNWASSNTAVATINTSGLASATSAGHQINLGNNVLGDRQCDPDGSGLPPSAISTNSLPNGTMGSSYRRLWQRREGLRLMLGHFRSGSASRGSSPRNASERRHHRLQRPSHLQISWFKRTM